MISLQPEDLELAPATILLLIVLAAMLQDDLTCITVGLFASNENLWLPTAWCACFVGTLVGDLFWYALARWCGPPLLSRPPLNWVINPAQLERATAFIYRYGSYSIVACRFLPGIRTSLQLVIGTLHQNPVRAVSVFALAALVYTLLIIGFCRIFRNTIDVLGIYEQYGTLAALFAAIAVLFVIWLGKRSIESYLGKY